MAPTYFLYLLFLTLHNLVRWVVIAAAVYALGRAFHGWLGKRDWTRADEQAGRWYITAFDVQILLGLILYFFFSQAGAITLQNLGAAMADPNNLFFGVVHWLVIAVAAGIAHVGRVLARRQADATARHMRLALFFSASIVLVLLTIPWEGLPYGRPLFRLFGISY